MEQSWLVTGAAAPAPGPSRDDVPFVGRRGERTLLDAAVELVRTGTAASCRSSARPAPARPGWSRRSSGRWRATPIVVRTACAPYGERGVWAPGGHRASRRCSASTPTSHADDVRAAVEAKAARDLGAARPTTPSCSGSSTSIAHLLGHPSELDRLDAAGARDVIAAAVTDMMRRHAQTRMTVLWIDNLQWADPAVRDLLAVVVRSLADLPFLLVTAQRPDADVVWPPPVDRPLVVRVPLGPLDVGRPTALVRHVVERASSTPARRPRGRRARRPRRRQPAVPRRAGRPRRHLRDRRPSCRARCGPSSPPASTSCRSPQRAIIDNAAVLGSGDSIGALARSPRRWARSSATSTWTSWWSPACSTSTASGGASAATWCARSPTRR